MKTGNKFGNRRGTGSVQRISVSLPEGIFRMEVVVVQGPVHILKEITEKILSCKGVLSCKLTLADIVIPQVHSAPALRRDPFVRLNRNS